MIEQPHTPPETALHLQELAQSLRNDAEALLNVMRKQFGEKDTRTGRAGEICSAIQRLSWDFERHAEHSIATAS